MMIAAASSQTTSDDANKSITSPGLRLFGNVWTLNAIVVKCEQGSTGWTLYSGDQLRVRGVDKESAAYKNGLRSDLR